MELVQWERTKVVAKLYVGGVRFNKLKSNLTATIRFKAAFSEDMAGHLLMDRRRIKVIDLLDALKFKPEENKASHGGASISTNVKLGHVNKGNWWDKWKVGGKVARAENPKEVGVIMKHGTFPNTKLAVDFTRSNGGRLEWIEKKYLEPVHKKRKGRAENVSVGGMVFFRS